MSLSQPSASAALGRLRDALDDQLFERRGNSLQPTAYAVAIEPELRQILVGLEQLFEGQQNFSPKHSRQTFRIAASDYFADYLMPPLISRFRKEAPHARLQLTPLDAHDHLNSLERFKTDLIIFLSLPVPGWMRAKDAFVSHFRVMAQKEHVSLKRAGIKAGDVIPFDIYCGLEHALYSPSGEVRTWVDTEMEKVGRKRRISASNSTFHGLAKLVEASDLLATVPELTARDFANRYNLEVYRHPLVEAKSTLMMAWHYRNDAKPDQVWFRKLVDEELKRIQDRLDRERQDARFEQGKSQRKSTAVNTGHMSL